MNKAVPWSIKGVDFNAREAAKEAARRAGMTLGDWLNSVIADQADELGIDPDDVDDNQRVEAVSRRLARLAPRGVQRSRAGKPADEDFDERFARRAEARGGVPAQRGRRSVEDEDEGYDQPRREPLHPPARRYETNEEPDTRYNVDAEALLDEAVRGIERGSRRHQAQTNSTLDKFARRLAELETHLNERAERAAGQRTERRERVVREADDRREGNRFDAIEKKLSLLVDGAVSDRAAPVVADSDIARLEAKLNALLEQQKAPTSIPAGPRHASVRAPSLPPSRLPLSDALSQIVRRQRDLDMQGPSPARAPSPVASSPSWEAPQGLRSASEHREMSSLRSDIAALAASMESLRRDIGARASEPAAPISDSAVEQLRKQVAEMNAVVGALPQRESFAALEAATRDLVARVESSRHDGVRENILQPIEQLVAHIQRVMTEFSPRATIDAIKREIGVIAQSVGAVGPSAVDGETLAKLNEQTREIRELLQQAVTRQAPFENIERQLGDLARRIDLIAQRGSTPAGTEAVSESVEAIRDTVESLLPTSLLATLEQRVEALGRKIDQAVHRDDASVETRALEDMMRDIAARLDRPQAPVADFSQLEDSVRELARRVDTAGRADATPVAFDALQEQIARLAARLDRSDSGLPDLQRSIAEIVGLIEQNRSVAVQAAEQAARTAAREAMAQIGAMPADTGRGQISDEISSLRDGQESMDRRTRATLTAVHETLEKVVDRLAMIEGGYQPPQARSAQPASEQPDPRLPNASFDADLLASGPAPSFARTGAPLSDTGEPSAEGLGRQVSAEDILRAGRGPRKDAGEAPPVSLEDDILIEPRSSSRKSSRDAAARQTTPLEQDDVPGSAQQSFIAAARRARETAEGAATQRTPRSARGSGDDALAEARARAKAAAAALASDSGKTASGIGPIGRVRAFVNERKRPILLSLAGIVLALGALTVMRSLNEEPPPNRMTIGAAPSRDAGKIVAQADRDRATRSSIVAAPGANAPVTADELAALGDKFTQPQATLEARAAQTQVQASVLQQALGVTDTAPVGSISASVAPGQKAQDLRSAATAGNASAQFEYATRLFEGRGIARDPAQAAQWFEKAALQDLAPAQYRLGSLYEKGVGVARDPARARSLYLRAADRGNIRAMHNLAVLYAEGAEGKPDYASAAQWFRKAADYGVRDSQFNLAILYARGLGVAQDFGQSWIWLTLAAAQGDEDAGKKSKDVAARLDVKQMAAVKAVVDNFKPRIGDKASNDVVQPPGGWEIAPLAAAASPLKADPKTDTKSEKRLPTASPGKPRMTAL